MKLLLETIGRTMGAVFHLTEVRNLPSTPKPVTGTTLDRVSKQLPTGYLRIEAEKLLSYLHRKYDLSETDLEEVVSNWAVRVASNGWEKMPHGMTLGQACNYIRTRLRNDVLTFIKTSAFRDGFMSDEDFVEPSYETTETAAVWNQPHVRKILAKRAHPDAPAYLDAFMAGYETKEIIEGMLPNYHASVQYWQKDKMPLICKILKAHS
jgi:hypothetical protein